LKEVWKNLKNMTDIKLRQLAQYLAGLNKIRKSDAKFILSKLNPKDLRTLFSYLKDEIQKNTLELTVSDKPSSPLLKELQERFQVENINISEDPSLGSGMRIKNYDMIYDLTVKSQIKYLVSEVENNL